MRCLLDANALIFLDLEPERLSVAAQREILNPTNELHLSIASLWEMQLKIARGKLTLSRPLAEVVAAQCQVNGLRLFGIEPAHVYRLGLLPFHHNDPFDRMILAQGLAEDMAIITSDGEFSAYGVRLVW